MYWTNENPTELYYQRQELLLRKAQHARLARQLHREHQKFSSGTASGQRMARLRRMTALWGRTSVPFFRD